MTGFFFRRWYVTLSETAQMNTPATYNRTQLLTVGIGAALIVGEREGGLGHHVAPSANFVVATQVRMSFIDDQIMSSR